MLSYIKKGDVVSKEGIISLIRSIENQLKVWSITKYDRANLEKELNELKDLLLTPDKYGITLQ